MGPPPSSTGGTRPAKTKANPPPPVSGNPQCCFRPPWGPGRSHWRHRRAWRLAPAAPAAAGRRLTAECQWHWQWRRRRCGARAQTPAQCVALPRKSSTCAALCLSWLSFYSFHSAPWLLAWHARLESTAPAPHALTARWAFSAQAAPLPSPLPACPFPPALPRACLRSSPAPTAPCPTWARERRGAWTLGGPAPPSLPPRASPPGKTR